MQKYEGSPSSPILDNLAPDAYHNGSASFHRAPLPSKHFDAPQPQRLSTSDVAAAQRSGGAHDSARGQGAPFRADAVLSSSSPGSSADRHLHRHHQEFLSHGSAPHTHAGVRGSERVNPSSSSSYSSSSPLPKSESPADVSYGGGRSGVDAGDPRNVKREGSGDLFALNSGGNFNDMNTPVKPESASSPGLESVPETPTGGSLVGFY